MHSAHLAHLYCLCSVHWEGYKNNKPMVLVHQELAVILRSRQNSLCKVCDCCFDTQYSWEVREVKNWEMEKTVIWTESTAVPKDSRNRREWMSISEMSIQGVTGNMSPTKRMSLLKACLEQGFLNLRGLQVLWNGIGNMYLFIKESVLSKFISFVSA